MAEEWHHKCTKGNAVVRQEVTHINVSLRCVQHTEDRKQADVNEYHFANRQKFHTTITGQLQLTPSILPLTSNYDTACTWRRHVRHINTSDTYLSLVSVCVPINNWHRIDVTETQFWPRRRVLERCSNIRLPQIRVFTLSCTPDTLRYLRGRL